MDDLIGRDPQRLSTPDLVSAITGLAGHRVRAAQHRAARSSEPRETRVRQFRTMGEPEALSREARQQSGRGLSYLHNDDGSLVMMARLPAEAGAQ